MSRFIPVGITLAVVSIAAAALHQGSSPAAIRTPRQTQLLPTEETVVPPAPMVQSETSPVPPLQSVARPSELAVLAPLTSGTIAEVLVAEGQTVTQGQVLVKLDDRILVARHQAARLQAENQGAVRRAELELQAAQDRLKRLQQALSQQAAAPFELEEQSRRLALASATLQDARDRQEIAAAQQRVIEQQMEQLLLRAPFDGLVVQLHHRSGTLTAGTPVVTVANHRTLRVDLHVPAHSGQRFQAGHTVSLQADAPVRQELTGQVLSVSPVIDFASETVRCVVEIPNEQLQLPAGFAVTVSAPVRQPQTAAHDRLTE